MMRFGQGLDRSEPASSLEALGGHVPAAPGNRGKDKGEGRPWPQAARTGPQRARSRRTLCAGPAAR